MSQLSTALATVRDLGSTTGVVRLVLAPIALDHVEPQVRLTPSPLISTPFPARASCW